MSLSLSRPLSRFLCFCTVLLVAIWLSNSSLVSAGCGFGQVDWGIACIDDGECSAAGGGCVSNYLVCTCLGLPDSQLMLNQTGTGTSTIPIPIAGQFGSKPKASAIGIDASRAEVMASSR